MKTYEIKTEFLYDRATEAEMLSALGKAGWWLASVIEDPHCRARTYFFNREIPASAPYREAQTT